MTVAQPEHTGAPVDLPVALAPRRETDAGAGLRLSRRTFDALNVAAFRALFFANFLAWGSMQMQQFVRGVLVYDFTRSFAALGQVSRPSLAHASAMRRRESADSAT